MYCQPKFAPEAEIYVPRGAERAPLSEAAGEPSELQRRRRDYVRRREMWGGLLAPDDLGREALRAAGDADEVEIAVRRLVIDPATARLGCAGMDSPFLVSRARATAGAIYPPEGGEPCGQRRCRRLL
jgi:hypothetical protein